MFESLDETLNLRNRTCNSLREAEQIGEDLCGATYHILVKRMKQGQHIELVYHLSHIECMFCAMDDRTSEPFIWL